ncbi:MAG: family 10 glycosylhydrolase [Deltaproteobacteria bacterium]|jgi:uncharacterized lipoprotein YddW (UPF0748 family)
MARGPRRFGAAWLPALLLLACVQPDDRSTFVPTDGGTPDGGVAVDDRDGGEPTTRDAGGEPVMLVDVGHERELRGVWVATVANINFPSRTGLDAEALRAELEAIVDTVEATHLNAIFFQVRPESDALYASALEPWSRFLTGTQGQDPGLDPLAELLALAHARGIEVHAWLNPYRAKSSRSSTAVAPHIAVEAPSYAYTYGNLLWMDPGAEVVQQRLLAVVEDLVARYPLDGLHFDDYFYPYPDGTAFPDDVTYGAYVNGGGAFDVGDWRRDNVNQMVEAVGDVVSRTDPACRFGISPFGIYRPGIPEGIVGLDQYGQIYADPVKWMAEGWVDYLAPQLYWPSTQTRQAYGPLIAWWSSLTHGGRAIFAGNYLSKVGTEAAWSVSELETQIALSRMHRGEASLGNIHFHIGPLMENTEDLATVFAETLYPTPVLTPPLANAPGGALAAPMARADGANVELTHTEVEELRAYVIYLFDGGAPRVSRIVAPDANVTLPSGNYAVSAVDRFGRESRGFPIDID